MRCITSLFLVALTACCGFNHVNDGGSGGDMAGVGGSGGGGGDAGSGGGGGGGTGGVGGGGGGGTGGTGGGGGGGASMCTGCGCGAPVLVVGIKSINGATGNDGRVLQLSLPSTGLATACGPQLTAAGSLSKSVNSVGWAPPDGVLFGSSESVLLLDGVHDQIRMTYRPPQSGDTPVDVFMLARAGMPDVVAIGYNTVGGTEIDKLYTVDAKSGALVKIFDFENASGPMPLGNSVAAIAADPFDATRLVYVDNGINAHPATRTTVAWDDMVVKPLVWYATRPPGSYPSTLQTITTGKLHRAVWAQTTSSSTADDVIYEIDDDGTGPTLNGPLKCGVATLCAQPFKTTDAAPDPTMPARVLATCDSPTTNVKHVVRIDASGCSQVVDGSQLLNLTYPVALAVGNAR